MVIEATVGAIIIEVVVIVIEETIVVAAVVLVIETVAVVIELVVKEIVVLAVEEVMVGGVVVIKEVVIKEGRRRRKESCQQSLVTSHAPGSVQNASGAFTPYISLVKQLSIIMPMLQMGKLRLGYVISARRWQSLYHDVACYWGPSTRPGCP